MIVDVWVTSATRARPMGRSVDYGAGANAVHRDSTGPDSACMYLGQRRTSRSTYTCARQHYPTAPPLRAEESGIAFKVPQGSRDCGAHDQENTGYRVPVLGSHHRSAYLVLIFLFASRLLHFENRANGCLLPPDVLDVRLGRVHSRAGVGQTTTTARHKRAVRCGREALDAY